MSTNDEVNETENLEKNQEYQQMIPPNQIPLQPPPFGPMYPIPMGYPPLAFPTPYPFPTPQMAYPQNIASSRGQVQCRFGRKCLRQDCHFLHAEGRELDENPQKVRSSRPLCHFGRKCRRPDCFFQHPEGREIDDANGTTSPSLTSSGESDLSGFTTDEIAQLNAALEDMVNQEVLDSLSPEDREAYLQIVNEPSDDEDDIDLDAVARELASSKTPEPETQAKDSQ